MLGDSTPPEGNAPYIVIGGEPIKNTLQELDENQLKNLAIRNIHDRLDENQLKKSQERWTRTNSKNLNSSFP